MSLFSRLSSNYFFYFSILGLITPFLAVFLDGKGFSSVELGEILALVTTTRIIGPSLWAMLADKLGKRLLLIRLGAFFALFSFSFLFWLSSYWPITLCLAFFSFFWTAVLPQLEVFTLSTVRHNGKIYARIRLWGSLGFIALAVIGGEAINHFGYEAFSYLGWLILFALFISTLLLKSSGNLVPEQVVTSILNKLLNKEFIVFILAGILLQISFGPYYNFFALYLNDLHYPSYAVGLLISVGVLAEIVVFINMGLFLKQMSFKTILVFSLAITALRWFLTGEYGHSVYILILSQTIHAASFALYHSASMLFLQQYFDKSEQSRGQAIYIGGVYGIGSAVGAYFTGLLWLDGAGAHNTFMLASITALFGAFLLFFMPVVTAFKK